MTPIFETIAIGDELLTGKIADTNSAWVASRLYGYGQRLHRATVVADLEADIVAAVTEASRRASMVVCFGGLGPTSDDKTAAVIARLLSTDLVEDEPSKVRLLAYYEERKRVLNEHSLKQVLYPRLARPLANENGMAPGFACRLGSAEFLFLPGVPTEMKRMFDTGVVPALEKLLSAAGAAVGVRQHTWKLLRIPEAEVQLRMNPIEPGLAADGWLGYRTRFPENHLSLYVPERVGVEVFESWRARIGALVKDKTYTEEPFELEELVIRDLKRSGRRVALAESCTGGMVAARLACVSGATDALWGSFVSYQVAAKDKMLGLRLNDPLEAVSAHCSRELARRAKESGGADLGVGVTGYLGAGTGTAADPAGTLYIAVQGETLREERILLPVRDRAEMQRGASTLVLDLLYKSL